MSLDRSLRSANALVRHRNVLTRAERLDQLKEEEKWNDQKPVFGLPKVAHRKMAVGGKVAKEEVAADAAAPAAGAKGAAPAAGKGAAPAKGAPAKGAAPAAKGAAPAKAAAPAAKGKK